MVENSSQILVYGHPACGMVPPVKQILRAAQVDFEYINIHKDSAARQRVRTINHGNESVPTLVFPDGSTLTEPSPSALRAKLSDLGYEVAPYRAWLSYIFGNPFNYIFIVMGLVILVRALGIF